MSIEFNGATNEKDSPFCVEKKDFCEKWEDIINTHNGKFKAQYNATSFIIHAKINLGQPWVFKISSSAFSSGNVLLSSEYQNLKKWSNVKTKIDLQSESFQIKEKTTLDWLKSSIGSKKFQSNYPFENYSTISTKKINLPESFVFALKSYFTLGKTQEVNYDSQTKELSIEIRDLIENPIDFIENFKIS